MAGPCKKSAAAEHENKENQKQDQAQVRHPYDAEAPTMDHACGRLGGTASENTYRPYWSASVTTGRLLLWAAT
jgi:hypothetical protein